MISGSTQKIRVTSQPSGATVTAEPGGARVTAPATMALRRKDGPYRLTFAMDGYQPYTVTLKTGTNGWLWGNLLIGGLIGITVDSSTGASTKLSPGEVHANLVRAGVDVSALDGNALAVFGNDGALHGILALE
jgi:hypothetical protein